MLYAVNNIVKLAAYDHHIISIVIDDDDLETIGSEELKAVSEIPNVVIQRGKSKSKVHAINRGMEYFEDKKWDILVNMSDDMKFEVIGFDMSIISAFDKEDMFVHFPDGYVNEKLPTMSIMDRAYYNRFKYIYHPSYTSLWCDNEAMEVAQILGKYKYVDKHIFKHNHPLWVSEPYDKQMIKNQSYYKKDQQVYLRRKKANFPI